jgi:hypothetical protein
MRQISRGLAALLSSVVLSDVPAGAEQGSQTLTRTLVPLTRFEGDLRIQPQKGASKDLRVVTRNWLIHGRQKIERFPEMGYLIVHLQSGKVMTVIDGHETARDGGAFWTVPAGSSMSVRVTSESALLEVTAVTSK